MNDYHMARIVRLAEQHRVPLSCANPDDFYLDDTCFLIKANIDELDLRVLEFLLLDAGYSVVAVKWHGPSFNNIEEIKVQQLRADKTPITLEFKVVGPSL